MFQQIVRILLYGVGVAFSRSAIAQMHLRQDCVGHLFRCHLAREHIICLPRSSLRVYPCLLNQHLFRRPVGVGEQEICAGIRQNPVIQFHVKVDADVAVQTQRISGKSCPDSVLISAADLTDPFHKLMLLHMHINQRFRSGIRIGFRHLYQQRVISRSVRRFYLLAHSVCTSATIPCTGALCANIGGFDLGIIRQRNLVSQTVHRGIGIPDGKCTFFSGIAGVYEGKVVLSIFIIFIFNIYFSSCPSFAVYYKTRNRITFLISQCLALNICYAFRNFDF